MIEQSLTGLAGLLIGRLLVGGLLLLAGLLKYRAGVQWFWQHILDYKLIKGRPAHLLARGLPGIENLCGVLLLLGLFTPLKFNRCPQVYLRDRPQGRTYLLSQPANGQLPDDGSFAGDISGNAAYAAIITGATNLTGTTLSEPFYNRKGFIVEIKQITLQFSP